MVVNHGFRDACLHAGYLSISSHQTNLGTTFNIRKRKIVFLLLIIANSKRNIIIIYQHFIQAALKVIDVHSFFLFAVYFISIGITLLWYEKIIEYFIYSKWSWHEYETKNHVNVSNHFIVTFIHHSPTIGVGPCRKQIKKMY